MRGAVSARTGRLCRVNGSAGASLSCCGLCAALPISPGRSLRSPRRVPGNPVPVPALSARAGPILGPAGQARRHGWVEPPKAPRRGKPRLRGAVSARTGRLCRVNGSAGASLSCCGLCAALPISPGRSLRSPRRVPGNPVPVPALSARRGRSSVLPVRPDGTGGSSRRRRPEGASPACGAQSRPARDGCAGSTALPVPLSPAAASVPLCRSVQGEACEALDGCRAILSRSRRCRLGGADPRSCRSGQTARVGQPPKAPRRASPACGAQSRPARDGCAVNGSAGASLSCCGLCAALPISPGRSLRSPRRVPGNPVPVPVLSARRGRSSVLPVRPDGTGGSSRRRRPEGASPACGAQSRPARDGCAGSTGSAGASLSCCGLCAAPADQSRAKPAKP